MFRDVAKGMARNTTILFVQQAITMSSSVLLLLFMPRYLGPVEYGRFYLGYSIAGIFQILVSFGANYQIAKNVARSPEQTGQIFVDSLALRIVLAMVSTIAIFCLGRVLNYPREQIAVLDTFAISLLVWSGIMTLYACYQGHELLQYTSYGAVGERVFMSAVTIVVLMFGAKAKDIALVVIGSGLVNLSLLALKARVILPSLPHVDWKNVRAQLRDGVPYFLLSVFGVIYYRIDSLMLSKLTPESVLGFYGGAHRLFESMNIPYQLTIVVYPVLARYWKDDSAIHRKTLQRSLEMVIVAALPVSVACILFADNIIAFFYGLKAYAETVILFQILCAGLIFLFVDMILATTLVASDRQRQLMVISFLAIPLNVGINWLLIPYFQQTAGDGAIGATTATGLTEICVMVSSLWILPRGILAGFRWNFVTKGVAAGVVMGLVAVVSRSGMPWVAALALSFVVFVFVFWLMKPLPAGEEEFMKSQVASLIARISIRFRRGAATPPVG